MSAETQKLLGDTADPEVEFVVDVGLILASRCGGPGPKFSTNTFCMYLSGSPTLYSCFSLHLFPSCYATLRRTQEDTPNPAYSWLLLLIAQPPMFFFHWQDSTLSGHLLQGGMRFCYMSWTSAPTNASKAAQSPFLLLSCLGSSNLSLISAGGTILLKFLKVLVQGRRGHAISICAFTNASTATALPLARTSTVVCNILSSEEGCCQLILCCYNWCGDRPGMLSPTVQGCLSPCIPLATGHGKGHAIPFTICPCSLYLILSLEVPVSTLVHKRKRKKRKGWMILRVKAVHSFLHVSAEFTTGL